MREEIHSFENNIESWELIEPLLKSVESVLKVSLVNKRKTDIDVRLPSLEGRIVDFSQSLYLFVVFFDSEGEGSVMHKFGGCFHKFYKRFVWNCHLFVKSYHFL